MISTGPGANGRPGPPRGAGSAVGASPVVARPPARASMRALRAHRRGGPEVLVTEDAPVPEPEPGEVLVAVHAAAVTFGELGWDATWTRAGHDRTPVVVAHEFSGHVVDAGAGVVRHRPGDEVYGLAPFDRDGAAAEFVAVPESYVAEKPRTLDHVRSAALALSGLTAWQALVDHSALAPGETVLVQGAAGGVGVFVVQLAVVFGGRVTATARARDTAYLRDLGARTVLDVEAGGEALRPGTFDVVVDCVGGEAAVSALDLLRPDTGRLITLSAPLPADRAHPERSVFFVVAANDTELAALAELADRYALSVPITATFGLERGREAFAGTGTHGRAPGKTVIVIPVR